MKKVLLTFLAILPALIGFGQQSIFQPGDYKDGVYEKENTLNRKFIPYTHLREGDVAWEKRVWRTIDVREKINQSFYYPIDNNTSRISFGQLLLKYILSGQIIAFTDEEFMIPLEKADIRKNMYFRESDSTESTLIDEAGNERIVMVATTADSTWMLRNLQTITVKEDWFFDKQKSVMEVRILGLGYNAWKVGKEDIGPINQFWVYFPACRPWFAKHEVYNPRNDSERRSFEDMFWKRQFHSVIEKESNVFDRRVDQYAKGIDALLESDRVKGDIFRWEHDLWHF
jgi:gliding motility associated protien GldN